MFTVFLFLFPILAQAASPDAIESNVGTLKLLCDRIVSAFIRDDRDSVGQGRDDVVPFIDASSSLGHYSTGSGLVHEGGSVRGVAIFDANGDGLLDIYITHDNRPPLIDQASSKELRLGNSLFLNIGNRDDGIPEFLDVSLEANVQELGRKSHGVSIADYDNDGRLDMYITNGVDGLITEDPQRMPAGYQRTYGRLNEGEGRNTLLHNEGNTERILANGRVVQVPIFSDQTDFAGVGDGSESFSSAWSDIDNDGFADLYVTNFVDLDYWGVRYPGLPAKYVLGEHNTLYHNNGDGTFTDITESAGVAGRPRPQARAEDRRNQESAAEIKDALSRTVNPGGVASHHSLWYDYDGDNLPDLFIANDFNALEVFHNNGDLTFTDVTEASGLDIEGAWMEVGLWDFNSDQRPDLYVTNLGAGAFSSPIIDEQGELILTRANGVFRNEGVEIVNLDGNDVPIPRFSYASDDLKVDWSKSLPPYGLTLRPQCHNSLNRAQGLEIGEFGWGAIFPDIDNDGDQDIYWIGGLRRADPSSQSLSLNNPGRLLRNDGDNFLTDITVEARVLNIMNVDYKTGFRLDLRFAEIGSGLAMGDLNNDGFPDIVIVNDADFTPFGHDPSNSLRDDEIVEVSSFLFINPGNDNNWIKIQLAGTISNRAALGAKVTVDLEDGRSFTKFLISGDVTGGQNALELLFGLGKSEVTRVQVHWPSGVVDTIDSPETNSLLRIVEGSS